MASVASVASVASIARLQMLQMAIVARNKSESCICCRLMTGREPESELVSLRLGDRSPGSS